METPLSQSSSSEMMAGHESLSIEKTKFRPEDAHPNTLVPVQSKIEHFSSRPREFTFIAIICMAQLMTQAALGQAIAPLHIIGSSFGVTNPGQLSWFAAAYSLTVGTFILIAGRLGDLYGHKMLFISGFFWFALWSLLAGFSAYSDAIFFDVARALQGIGPAFLLPNALAILARIYEPGRKKEMIFSLFGATAPTGFTLGATFSSIFAEFVWWPWAYWVTAIVCVLLAVVGIIVIPHTPPPQFDRSVSMFKRADGLGALTGVAGLVLVNFSWNQGPVIGWATVYVYVILIIGALVLGLFAFIESRAPYPLVPFGAFNSHTGYTLACIAGGWASFGIWIFYFWQLFEEIRGVSPLLASAMVSPTTISGLCASLTTGKILSKVPASTVMMIAMTGFLIGSILMATVPINQTYWAQTFVACLVTPWGMDMSFPAATILLSNSMHKDHQGLAASLVNTVVNYSISIGLGIAGTVEVQINNGGKNPRDLLKGYRGAQRQSITNAQSPSTSSQDVVDRGILDLLRSRYMSQHSAVAFPRSLGVEFQSANPPPLHSFAWNCGIRAEEAASAHTNLTQLVSFDDFKRFSDIYVATVHGPFGFLDWPYFMKRCNDYWTNHGRDLTFGAVVGGVVALGSFFAFRLGHPRELEIVQHVKTVLEDPTFSRHPSIDQINAWILRTLYLRSTTRPHVAWLASCVTLHLAEATGLHQEVHSVLLTTEGDTQAKRMDQAEIERARKTFWMAWSVHTIISYEYGRSAVILNSITCKPVKDTMGDSTIFHIKIAQLIPRDNMVVNSVTHKEELISGLKELAQIPDVHPFLSLSKADVCFCFYRRLRLMKQGLEKEAIQAIIDIGNKGAEAANTFARNGHPWWNILSTTFQYFCVLLAIDTSESLSNVSWVLNIFENIVRIVDTHLAHEAFDTAKVLLRDSMAKKRRDLGFLENADGQHGPEIERQVDINWDALLDPTFPDALMSEDFSIYNS
ncbi:hypothetical protein BCON_0395g00020 [Botryotinia convoluta]|uniref:Major facilitator superfamily (MFS) profile domain-containing protein n=1 Tax=Botryotinia convoluta TaxID=54673 RepID=A0A4Z1HK87_9HELO|nr:hypothetical protein BCON_0395g00020 [Botryotinia convoluta]